MVLMKHLLLIFFSFIAMSSFAGTAYMTHEEFLHKSFGSITPVSKTLWLTTSTKTIAEDIVKRPISQLRFRYWQLNNTTTWVLDEIGKEQPITIGIKIDKGEVTSVDILQFRETRGYEVRFPFFTKQFKQARLLTNFTLSQAIDGISGATLSVSAVKRSVQLALFLDQQVSINEHQ